MKQPTIGMVADVTPKEALAFLRRSSGSPPSASILDFSPSNILETMDTVVLDQVRSSRGEIALQRVYDVIAGAVLGALREAYPAGSVLVALDAGHGGGRGEWDGGAAGTEAGHNRGVVAAIERAAGSADNSRLVLRRIFNDEIADDLGMPRVFDKPVENRIFMRQARAAMLAAEALRWNATPSGRGNPVAMHEISVHFNAGSGGAMVLHQGSTVRPAFAAQSVDFARRFLARVLPELNATGLLPSPLKLWGGNGLHDDVMMYRPAHLTDDDIAGLTLRYGALQGQGYLARYAETALRVTSQP